MVPGNNEGTPISRIEGAKTVLGEEAKEILESATIDPGTFNGRLITKDLLSKQGMLPVCKVDIPQHYSGVDLNTAIYLSSPFQVDDRPAVIGYVKSLNSVIRAQTYYLSHSQGVWRDVPYYYKHQDKKDDKPYYVLGKGYSEESITLPYQLQMALANLVKSVKPLSVDDPELFLHGTTHELPKPAYDGSLTTGELFDLIPEGISIPYERAIDPPLMLDERIFGKRGAEGLKKMLEYSEELKDSEELKKHDLYPDFTQSLKTWNQKLPLYGETKTELIPSNNGDVVYLFNTDPLGRVWISSVQFRTRNTSDTGLSIRSIDSEVLTVPAFEYDDQTYGYGNDALRNGYYIDMFKNYLSKIHVISDYLKHSGASS